MCLQAVARRKMEPGPSVKSLRHHDVGASPLLNPPDVQTNSTPTTIVSAARGCRRLPQMAEGPAPLATSHRVRRRGTDLVLISARGACSWLILS
jgi:hypothetical protein